MNNERIKGQQNADKLYAKYKQVTNKSGTEYCLYCL